MAVSVGTLSAGQTAALLADKPVLLANNLLETGYAMDVTAGAGPESISACWRSPSGSDALPIAIGAIWANSDPWQSPLKAFDRKINSFTAPISAPAVFPGKNKHCFIAIVTPNSEENAVDSLVIGAHNFAEIDPGSGAYPLQVHVYLSDDPTFATYVTILSWNVTVDHLGETKRIVSLHSNKFWGVRYVQVVVSLAAGAGFLPAPQIGEIFLSSRKQLSRYPDEASWGREAVENTVGEHHAESGVTTRYSLSSGRSSISPKWSPGGDTLHGTEDLYGLNDLATFDSFWEETAYGSKPFFFIPHPNAPQKAYFMYSEKMEFPSTVVGGLTDREVEFDFKEISPFVSSEV